MLFLQCAFEDGRKEDQRPCCLEVVFGTGPCGNLGAFGHGFEECKKQSEA